MRDNVKKALRALDARVKLFFLVAYAIACLHAQSPASLALCAVGAGAVSAAAALGVREIARAMRALLVIVVFTAVMQVLYYQQGPVLAVVGPVAITSTALAQTARMVVSLACIVAVNVAFMRVTSADDLVSALGWMAKPIERLGLRTDAFMVSLSVTFRFVPVLVGDFTRLRQAQLARNACFDGSVRQRVMAYARLFAPLVRGSFRRADTLAQSYVSRCFGAAEKRTVLNPRRFQRADLAGVIVAVLFAMLVLALG